MVTMVPTAPGNHGYHSTPGNNGYHGAPGNHGYVLNSPHGITNRKDVRVVSIFGIEHQITRHYYTDS